MTAVTTAAAQIAPTLTLSEEQIAFFHREGWLRIERITTDEEAARIRAALVRLFAERAGRESGMQFDLAGTDEEGRPAGLPQILGVQRFAPEVGETLYCANAQPISQQLWGDPQVKLTGGGHSILKPARIGRVTPWHQDEAYWDPWHDHRGLSIWLALQPATVANGCMWFVPRSHLGGILPHRSIDDDPRIHGLEVVDPSVGSAGIPVELPAGGAVIHHCRTLHYAGPNTTEVDRHAYIVGGHAAPTRRAERREVPWMDAKRTPRMERAARFTEQPPSAR